jgi:hypothetical protein
MAQSDEEYTPTYWDLQEGAPAASWTSEMSKPLSWYYTNDASGLARARNDLAAWGGAPDIVKAIDAGKMDMNSLTSALTNLRWTTTHPQNTRFLDDILHNVATATGQAQNIPWTKFPTQSPLGETLGTVAEYLPQAVLAVASLGQSIPLQAALLSGGMAGALSAGIGGRDPLMGALTGAAGSGLGALAKPYISDAISGVFEGGDTFAQGAQALGDQAASQLTSQLTGVLPYAPTSLTAEGLGASLGALIPSAAETVIVPGVSTAISDLASNIGAQALGPGLGALSATELLNATGQPYYEPDVTTTTSAPTEPSPETVLIEGNLSTGPSFADMASAYGTQAAANLAARAASGIQSGNLTYSQIEPETEVVKIEAQKPTVTATELTPEQKALIGGLGAGAVAGLTGGLTDPAAIQQAAGNLTASPEDTSTIDKIIGGAKAVGIASSLLGGLGGGGTSGTGATGTIPSSLAADKALKPIFSASLPTLPRTTGVGAPRELRDLSGIDWYRYGQGPERSFFTNIPERVVTAARGGSLAVPHKPRASFAVQGPGDGRSDDIPALLSDGEYVMDAETVSLLGNGSNKAGAARLDGMRKNIRKQKGKALAKGRFSVPAKAPQTYLRGGRT